MRSSPLGWLRGARAACCGVSVAVLLQACVQGDPRPDDEDVAEQELDDEVDEVDDEAEPQRTLVVDQPLVPIEQLVTIEHEPTFHEAPVARPYVERAAPKVAPRRHTEQLARIDADLVVIAELAPGAPAFGEHTPDERFVTQFVVREVIEGQSTVGEIVELAQDTPGGVAPSDGFLRARESQRYVLMLDTPTDGGAYVLAGGGEARHLAFLVEREDGKVAPDRGVPIAREELVNARRSR